VAHLAVVDPEALYILLTQDCDILHHDYDDEPDIELHIARPAAEEDGNLFNAKNPRSLQFTSTDRLYEIRMHERCRAPRGCLLGHAPRELNLGEDLIRTIIRWTANRYLRSAFPDAFNERLAAARKSMRKIEAALKRDGALITGIFLWVDPPEEIAAGEQYRVIVRLTAREEVLAQTATEISALALTETIRQEFDGIDGVEIIDYQLVSEADFSLADMRTMLRWDYDYLSYRAGTPDNTAPAAT
jgi:hypothetical protein